MKAGARLAARAPAAQRQEGHPPILKFINRSTMLILQGDGEWELNFCFSNSVINLSSKEAIMMPGREKEALGAVCGFSSE